jgi:hypothetical protein
MAVRNLHLTNFGPIKEIDIHCDRQINVLIGPNNCGKTSILLALADILINPFNLPLKLLRGDSEFQIDLDLDRSTTNQPDLAISLPPLSLSGVLPIEVGEKGKRLWTSKKFDDHSKTVSPLGFRCFIPALRLNTDFRSQGPNTKSDASQSQSESILERGHSGRKFTVDGNENPSDFLRDSRIVQDIIALDYHAYLKKDMGARKVIASIFQLTSQITEGFPITFEGIGEDSTGYFIEFKTPDGKVPFNVLSQGTQALIQWIARVVIGMARYHRFPVDLQQKPGVLILDEIDAHLHPAWQRNLLPALSAYYPNLQIFCSAHSPLLLSGLKKGQIHNIRRNAGGNPTISTNEQDVSGWSVDEIMTHYYGLFAATDTDTEGHLRRLEDLRAKRTLSTPEKKELEILRQNLAKKLGTGSAAKSLSELAVLMQKAALGPTKIAGATTPQRKISKPKKKPRTSVH